MSRSTRNLYQWKTETEEGEKRHVEAQLFGKNWTWRSRLKGEEEWTDHSKPLLEDLEELEHMIFNKSGRPLAAWAVRWQVPAAGQLP
jgi:hypothetical protein